MPYAAGLAEDEKIHRMHCNKKVVVKPIQFTVSQSFNTRVQPGVFPNLVQLLMIATSPRVGKIKLQYEKIRARAVTLS